MENYENIYLVEYSPEAMEAVKSDKAVIGPGGIRRIGENGKGFLELAKPALISVADFQSLFEGKDHADITDVRITHLENQLALSSKGLQELQTIGWLNNAVLQGIYTLTFEGFKQTLVGLECVARQVTDLSQYVHERDINDLLEKTQMFINYLKTDAGNLRSKKYNVVNSNIAEHLDQISAFIKRVLNEIDSNDNSFVAFKILINLLSPFANVVRQFSSYYYYENDGEYLPGNYDEWVGSIGSIYQSKPFCDKCFYYVNLRKH